MFRVVICILLLFIYIVNGSGSIIGEILSSQTYIAGHVLLLKSLDWTNTGISFIFLTVNL